MNEFFKKFLVPRVAIGTLGNILSFILLLGYINQDQLEMINTLGITVISFLSQRGIMYIDSNKS